MIPFMFSKCKPIYWDKKWLVGWLVGGRQKGGVETEQNTVVPPHPKHKGPSMPPALVYRKAEVTHV